MSNGVLILLYIFMAYGACNIIVFGSGPFKIFERIRYWAEEINEHFGQMFNCMMCLPTNFGILISLFNWFLISVPFTPFNIVFAGTSLWWLAMLCDGAFTSGVVWLINTIQEYFENKTITSGEKIEYD